MAISGVTGRFPTLEPILRNRINLHSDNGVTPATVTTNTPASTDLTTPQQQEPIPQTDVLSQNELLINDILRNTIFQNIQAPNNQFTEARSPLITALNGTEDLTHLQENALRVNEILQDLNFVAADPTNILLINELPATLEAQAIFGQLNPGQENDLLINQTLQVLGPESPGNITRATRITPLAPSAAVAENPVVDIINENRAPAPEATAEPATTAQTDTTDQATVAATQGGVAASGEEVTAIKANLPQAGLRPQTLPVTLFPDRTPYVLAAYIINNPAPLPDTPEPRGKEVQPVTPVNKIQGVASARFRQLLQRSREERRTYTTAFGNPRIDISQAEKSLRLTINQVNSNRADQASPLHLVMARYGAALAVGVYDCSYDQSCRLTYEVPIDLDNLTGVLGNLQQGTGIIVNTAF